MKNYLFRPFSDDDAKIENFNALKDYLPNKFKQPLIMFMGRLESYYDKIISDLSNRCAVAVVDERIIKGLEDEIRELKAENKQLTQTIKYSNGNDGLYDEIVESNEYLEEQIKELKVENIKLNSECWCGCNDDLRAEHMEIIAENKRLKAENVELKEGLSNEGVLMLQDDNKRLMSDNKKRLNEIIELTDDNKRLVKQVSSISSNSSSTHTHTISKEIAEYMSHNEGCMGARMFLIPRDEFKHGEYDNTIYWDDGME